MFDRALFKGNAKVALKRFYWMAMLAVLIVYLISYAGSAVISGISSAVMAVSGTTEQIANLEETINNSTDTGDVALAVSQMYGSMMSFVLPFSVLLAVFVTYPLTIGQNRFYLNARENPCNLGDIWTGFKTNYGKKIWTMFCVYLFQSLWSLLFIIPGIVKSFEYSMIPYLLAENPNMSRKRAFQLSKAMTKGYKGDLFVLGLSFIGWGLLSLLIGIVTCGIGSLSIFFLLPYISATYAEAYTFLKARALENGAATAEDFPGFPAIAAAE